MTKNIQKAVDLREKTAEELVVELESALKEYFSLRMQKKMQQLTNTSLLKSARRLIARIRTILHEKVSDNGSK